MKKKEYIEANHELIKDLACERNRRKECEEKLEGLKVEVESKEIAINKLLTLLESYQPAKADGLDDACKMGPWCKVCMFHGSVRVGINRTVDICNKSVACENFTPIKED